MSHQHALRRYVVDLISYARWRAPGAFLLSLAAALSEGLGLLILIPLLYVLGLAPDQGSGGVLAKAITRAFAAFGLPLSLPPVLAAFVMVMTLRTLLTCARDLVVTEIQYGFVDHLRTRLYAAIGRASWLFLVRILALARALLCQPSLLILDEATSALDSESELRVQSAIEALHGRLTMVVIAHRLSTVRSADQVVVLDGGRWSRPGHGASSPPTRMVA